ncbi:substrate-binding periplasmic protein [Magnetospirillum molischianum]|uniref:Putative ABC transporter, periplasmic domain n=1 Tax=Magnetospirillum molischianum DSM 120 TaxID=1150626 RepID=H8FMY5_MAGML|nr:transporter substrate-binding domain-containing protein [Magnetospirillum molischianum]CCG39723.1 putative ABC transporter, periplasmic domain [Magnetospirillum molischianum DSM 120]
MKGLLLAVLILVTLPFQAAAVSPTVVLAADPWCPHICPADLSHPGYMVEVARRAFAVSGVTVIYRAMSWSRAIADAREGRIDGVMGTLASRAEALDLPQEGFGRNFYAFAVRADESWTFTDLASLEERTIGVVQGYSYSPALDPWLAEHRDQIQALGGQAALERNLRKLLAGRIDTLIEDEAVLKYRLKSLPEARYIRLAGRIESGALYIAFSRRDGRGTDLARMFDSGVRSLRASGELDLILARYGIRDQPR